MLDFIRIACAVPAVRVGDTAKNAEDICAYIEKADGERADIVLFPELALTGYTCQDLFFQDTLWTGVQQGIRKIAGYTKNYPNVTAVVGLPVRTGMRMYNCAAVISRGKIHALVPKTYIPNYNEFYEKRWFSSGAEVTEDLAELLGEPVPVLPRAVFRVGGTLLGVEICEDMWTPLPPSTFLALNGAEVILNLSASNETIGKRAYRRGLVQHQSAALNCVYAYCSAGSTESTQDLIFSGQSLIGEDGRLLAETEEPIASDYMLVCDCDLGRIRADRMKNKGFKDAAQQTPGHPAVLIDTRAPELRSDGTRYPLAKLPFVPAGKQNRVQRCMEIFHMQVAGLKQRLAILGSAKAVVGISGGVDSTLAVIICAEAVKMMGLPADYVTAVTMPCFGTTDRTKSNAIIVSEQLGATVRVIDIGESVMQHFKDIGHDPENRNVVYENSQARERTQILMDVANGFADGGIHVGTEDMSEFADGWCTYNGDHISMYDVNAGSTKTMVQMVVRYVAETTDDKVLAKALLDVLDTPVSPELLPPTRNGEIAQKSEDSVGPYNLQDFFLYYLVDHGFAPEKVLRLADIAYGDEFDHATLKKWLRSYCRRLFSQQFKRSCLQDGPTLNGFSFSPRTGFSMPSDGSDALYLATVDALK